MALQTRTAAPVRKVTASVAAAALVTVVVYVLNTFVLAHGQAISPEVATAISTLLVFAVGYLTPPGSNDGLASDTPAGGTSAAA